MITRIHSLEIRPSALPGRTLMPALAFVSLLCFGLPLQAQITKVRNSDCGPVNFPTSCAIPATGSGNLIVIAWASSGSSTAISGISDNVGNVYAQAPGSRSVNSAAGRVLEFWYAKNSKPGATSVTVTPNASGVSGTAVIWEFANVDLADPLDSVAVLNSQPSTTTPSGPSLTVAGGSLIVSAMITTSYTTGLVSGNPFSSDSLLNNDGWASLITTAAGAYSPRWTTSTAGSYLSSSVSFKASQGPLPPTQLNDCDLNISGGVTEEDVQLAANMTVGLVPCTAKILGTGVCNAVVVQRIVNAALGGACVVGNPHTVTLNWVASTSTGVTGYNIYRGTASGGPYSLVNQNPVTAVSYVDSIVEAGKTYYYVVKARDANGNESGPSNEATAPIPFP